MLPTPQSSSPTYHPSEPEAHHHHHQSPLTAQAKSLYRSLLRHGFVAYNEIFSLCGLPRNMIQPAIAELMNLGLVHAEDDYVTAVPYSRAINTLLNEQINIFRETMERVRYSQLRLTALIREGAGLGGDSIGTVLATSAGADDTGKSAGTYRVRPQVSLAAIHPGAHFSEELLVSSLRRAEAELADGVTLRVAHQTTALLHHQSADYLHQIEQLGGQVRVRDHLPFRLIIVDDESAACCLRWQDGLEENLLIHGVHMIGLLSQLFETIWVDSVPLGHAEPGHVPSLGVDRGDTSPLDSQQQAILRYLADGATDQAIAHTFGVTTRTVTRRINEIYQKLGVRSRFQAGAEARKMGLI